MSKILFTGLSLGSDTEECIPCNIDYEWLINSPSALIWTDKILVPKSIWDMIVSGNYNNEKIGNAMKLIFESAESEGLIEKFNPSDVITTEMRNDIYEQVHNDRIMLAQKFAKNIRIGDEDKVPGELFIDDNHYCNPYLYSLYTGLMIARLLNAQCLYEKKAIEFCKYKFGITDVPKPVKELYSKGYATVFTTYLPNQNIIPEYVMYDPKKCNICKGKVECYDRQLNELENNLNNMYLWRKYDEIQELKSVINSIIKKYDKYEGYVNPEEIVRDFKKIEERIKRNIVNVFPKINRWSSLATIISTPVAYAGLTSANPLLTCGGAGIAGVSIITKEIIKILNSKYSWVGFKVD